MERSCNGLIGLVLSFFAGLYSLYYQYELNRIWARLGNPQEGSLVALPVGAAVPASTPDGVPDGPAHGAPNGTAAGEAQAARSGGAPGLRSDESTKNGPEDGSSAGA